MASVETVASRTEVSPSAAIASAVSLSQQALNAESDQKPPKTGEAGV
jgi:hypothetical protein